MLGGYEVLRRLSEGAAAEVFLARKEDTQQRVIIEVLKPELAKQQEIVTRFLEESRSRRALEHPNVARRVLEGTTTDGRPYAVTEAVGESISTLLTSNGPFHVEALLRLALPICDALHFMHERGMVHGNLKPSTVYVSPEGESEELKPRLVDWGLALMRPGKTMPRPEGQNLVESEYLSPERIKGQRATAASDIYGMGILMYEALTGFPPFSGTDSVAVRRKQLEEAPPVLPEHCSAVAPIITRCLAKTAVDRYPNAAALKTALSQALESTLTGATVAVELTDNLADASTESGQVMGSYELVEPLGEGAMGRVFLARHTKLGRMVALKLLKPEHAQNTEQLQRFIQEAQAVNKINHEHIVEIYDFVEDTQPNGQKRVYCVMEVLRGDTLGRVSKQAPMPLVRAARVIKQVAMALDAAHRVGVVHRDIKPDNIFITEKHGQDFVKVVDFGVAKLRGAEPIRDPSGPAPAAPQAQEDGATSMGVVIGTPAFMPPEQALGRTTDHRVDIYSLGVVLYRLVVGKVPFMAETFSALVQKLVQDPAPLLPEMSKAGEPVPDALRRLVASCLEKDPERRPQTMAEVANAIDGIITGLTPGAATPDVARTFPIVPVAVAGGAFVLALVAFLALRPETPPVPVKTDPVVAPTPVVILPAFVEATINSSPPGAKVTRGDTGEELGLTPLTTRFKRDPGVVKVTLSLDKHDAAEAEVSTEKDGVVQVVMKEVEKPIARPTPPDRPGKKPGKHPDVKPSKPGPNGKTGRDDVLSPFGN